MKKTKERKPVIRCGCKYSWKKDTWNRKYKVNLVFYSDMDAFMKGRCPKCHYFKWFLTRVRKEEVR
uniref:Uncharacterized protein n=1 Tax=viral metagenome TaxID=1070528 RepID=A0A6M3KX71_9ZZZZ